MEKFGFLSFLLLVLHTSSDEPGLVKNLIYVEKNLPWYEARMYCIDHHAELFSVSDENDLKYLSSSTKQLSWIGLYRGDPLWNWVDETRASYFNWYTSGDCVSINKNGLWYSSSCDNKFSIVCHEVSGQLIVHYAGVTWLDAKTHCKKIHDGFPVIRNVNENTIISSLISNGFAWTGLVKVTEDPLKETWRWENGEPLTYSNWNTTLFCAVMDWRGFLYDRVCFEEHLFVCFRKINSSPVFMLVNENKTWSYAQTHCKLLNMNLVMVKTQEEVITLVEYIHGVYGSFMDDLYFWIGLYNDPWHWSESTSKIRNWHSMQPDAQDFRNNSIPHGSCVASMDGEWFDEDCTEPLPFFCVATVRSMILVSEPKSWEEALEHCRDSYVDLVSLTSPAEQHVAQSRTEHVQNDYVWIGLRFLAGSWFWVYGDTLEYENWIYGGQPQCPIPNRCGALSVMHGTWEARPCGEKLNFLCFQK